MKNKTETALKTNGGRAFTGNELIAKFMGFSSIETEFDIFWNPPNLPKATLEKWRHHSNGLLFDSSWDWLMPVVHKILKTTAPPFGKCWSYEYIELEKTRIGNSIDHIYIKVLEFIKRYNSERGS